MQADASLRASERAFVALLKACSALKDLEGGCDLHDSIAGRRLLQHNVFIASALVDMYVKCGSFAKAQEVFCEIPIRDVVLWTTLIAGCVEHGRSEEALYCVKKMQQDGISPNAFTLVCSAKACGSLKASDRGGEIHTGIAVKGLERDIVIGNALIDMYAKCGLLETAKAVLYKLPVRDVVSWTALIDGYAECGCGEQALYCSELMQCDSVSPNAHTFASSVKACYSIEALDKCQEVHSAITLKGYENVLPVGSALINMYAKYSLLADAQIVFDELLARDVVTWTALIAGYAQIGASEKVFSNFNRMVKEGVKPNLVTFLNLLSACNHAGLVNKGLAYFETITKGYGFTPNLDHYTCMVDLLGRAGHLSKALAMIKEMPWHPDYVLWCTVLLACQKWRNVELARYAFKNAVRLDEKCMTAYVLMYNIYADAAMQEEANKVEILRLQHGVGQESDDNKSFTDRVYQ